MAAACGSDEESEPTSGSTDAAAETTSAPATNAGSSTTAGSAGSTTGGSSGSTGDGPSTGTAGCPAIDSSIDAEEGTGAGRFLSDMECALDTPLKAEGDPITVGFMNPTGDPQGSFPEASVAAEAAVDFINSELGGLGADIQNGKPGRPIQLGRAADRRDRDQARTVTTEREGVC